MLGRFSKMWGSGSGLALAKLVTSFFPAEMQSPALDTAIEIAITGAVTALFPANTR